MVKSDFPDRPRTPLQLAGDKLMQDTMASIELRQNAEIERCVALAVAAAELKERSVPLAPGKSIAIRISNRDLERALQDHDIRLDWGNGVMTVNITRRAEP